MVKRLTDQQRDEIVTKYIDNNPGRSPTEVFAGVKNYMSKQSYYISEARLIANKTIRIESKNKRDKSLFVNENDLIFKITKELDYFEKTYFVLLDRVLTEVKKSDMTFSRRLEAWQKKYKTTVPFTRESLLFHTLYLFNEMHDSCTFKLSFVWPFSIANRRYLQRIQNVVMERISRMYSKLHNLLGKHEINEHLKSTRFGGIENMLKTAFHWEFKETDKEEWVRDYELIGLEEYARSTMKSGVFSHSK
jgi:hypothetical protein